MAVGFDKFDQRKERERFRKMSDEELVREGRVARYMCAPSTNFGKPPRTSTWRRCGFAKKSGAGVTRNNPI
jgi:hypothetical protein